MFTFWVSSDLLNIIIANPPKMRTPEMSDEIAIYQDRSVLQLDKSVYGVYTDAVAFTL